MNHRPRGIGERSEDKLKFAFKASKPVPHPKTIDCKAGNTWPQTDWHVKCGSVGSVEKIEGKSASSSEQGWCPCKETEVGKV